MNSEFAPLDHFRDLLRFWWVIVLLGIAGGVFGYEINQTRTPVYESKAVFTVSLDFVQTGLLTDVEEDQAINAVTDAIGSTNVMQMVVDSLKTKNLDISLDELQGIATVDRQGFQIAIHANLADAQKAKDIADTWATIANTTVQNAIKQASSVDALERQLNDIETCLQQATATEPAFPPCQILDQASLLTSLDQAETSLADAKAQSLGIISAISVELSQKPQLPTIPRIYNRNVMVMGGALLGILAGIILVEAGFIGRWSKKNG